MKTLFCLLAVTTFVHGAGSELEGIRAPANTPCPSPEEARAKMTVPAGYEVRCWAHEPLVVNPVAMTWDARGRLWVVEAFEYPNGTELPVEKRPFGQEAKDDQYHPIPPNSLRQSEISDLKSQIPKDRVVILEDTDNDGIADKRTVFVEGLNLASAIICGDDGIYVGQQPHLIHFKDSNHDDKPDEWRVVLTGFGREDTHELVNSFCWGPDGWLYMTHGVFTNSKVRRPGVPEKDGFKFDAGIGRCRPVAQASSLSSGAAGILPAGSAGRMPAPQATGGTPVPPWEFEVFADGTSNPWGCDYDERGNFFVSACVIDHFFHMAPGGIYVRQGGAPENPYSYELLPSIVTHKHFRAAYAGIQIYQGGVYPQDTWGHAFIGNIHDNAIHEEVLTPVGATFKCEPRRDFLRANDGWFRPVSTRTGPDGNLWIMDWCDKYPCYQNAKANPEGVDRERGRIWRVVSVKSNERREASRSAVGSDSATPLSPKESNSQNPTASTPSTAPAKAVSPPLHASATALRDASRPTKDMDLSKLDTPALVKLLGDSNNWTRRWARRELVERLSPTFNRPLAPGDDGDPFAKSDATLVERRMVNADQRTQGRPLLVRALGTKAANEALWTLFQAKLISREEWVKAAESTSPDLRSIASRLASEDTHLAEVTMREDSLKSGSYDLYPALDRLALDPDAVIRYNVALAARCLTFNHLTQDLSADLFNHLRQRQMAWPSPQSFLSKVIESSSKSEDPPLSFAIWMAIEPELGLPGHAVGILEALGRQAPYCQPLSHILTQKSMRRLCDTRKPQNLDLCLDFLTKIKTHDVLLAHALDGLEKGQESGIIKPTKAFSPLFAEFAKSDNADVRKHVQNLSVLWGDAAAIERLVATMLDAKTAEAERISAVQTLRKVRNDEARKAYARVVAGVCDPGGVALGSESSAPSKTPANESPRRGSSASGPGSQTPATGAFALEVIRAASDLGGDDFPGKIAGTWSHLSASLQLAALDTLSSRPAWTHAMLDAVAAKKITATGFPATVRRQLATSKDKAIRDHAFKVLGAWKDSSDDVKALIAAKKKACLEGEPDIAAGKLLFQTTCMVCHTFHGGGQKVGPELIGSGRSNLDALLANVIDPNQIIGNGYENFIVTTKDNRTLMGRVTEDTPSHVKLLAIGGAETVVPRDQITKAENTHQSLMPMGFGGLPDDQFRNLVWYVLAPPEEGPLTPDKKKLLSTSIDAAPAKPKKTSWQTVDWESVSLWNTQWKVTAPEFQGTPVKRTEYHGRTNVLTMHPFEDKKTPAVLEQKLTIDPKKSKLKFSVAADDRGDWQLRVTVNGEEIKRQDIGHDNPRWKDVTIDLANYAGKEITVKLEGHPTGWAWEFGYWSDIRWE